MEWFNKLNGLEGYDYVSSKTAWKWYKELTNELKSKPDKIDKLDFLKYQRKEFIKTLFYKMDTKSEKSNPEGSFGAASQIEKELILEIEYLEFKIKNNIVQSKADNNKSNLNYDLIERDEEPSFIKPEARKIFIDLCEKHLIDEQTPKADILRKLRPILSQKTGREELKHLTLQRYIADFCNDYFIKGTTKKKKQ